LTSDQIYDECNGRLSREQTNALCAAGENAYLTLRAYCEKNAGSLSTISTNINYGKEYSQVIGKFINPELQEAAERVRRTGERELQKLIELSESVKARVENKMLDNEQIAEVNLEKISCLPVAHFVATINIIIYISLQRNLRLFYNTLVTPLKSHN